MGKRRRNDSPGDQSTSQRKIIGGEPTAPSEDEWKTMTRHTFFTIENEGEHYNFSLCNFALILPEGVEPTDSISMQDHWVGRIKDIRCKGGDPSQVWVRVQWLYSPTDIKWQRRKGLKFSKNERLLSTHYDFVHASCFTFLADVEFYAENDECPVHIGEDHFFYRATYDFILERVHIPSECFLKCLCGARYDPDRSSTMHFCPGKGCKKAYHATCLREENCLDKGFESASMPLSVTIPSKRTLTMECFGVSEPASMEYYRPKRKKRKRRCVSSVSSSPRASRAVSDDEDDESDFDPYEHVPDELLRLARSPMIKGVGNNLPRQWSCVTGNYGIVFRARELVSGLVIERKRLPPKWEEMLQIPGTPENERPNFASWIAGDEGFLCPNCKGPI